MIYLYLMNKEINDLIFVYGTLLLKNNPYADFLRKNAQFIAKGSFAGQLYDLGSYPGAVYIRHSHERVYGSIFKLYNPICALLQLDEYEGMHEPDGEYKRELVSIQTPLSTLIGWVYLYVLDYSTKKKISGDYLHYLKASEFFE